MKPTLVIMAAGLGNRYGSLKQLDKFGPSGETLIDYSIYDAIRAGFEKVVFIISKEIENEFINTSINKFKNHIKIDYAIQRLDDIPDKFQLNPKRKKPWGTGHAMLSARDLVKEPFALINADDFYGKEAYETMGKFLKQLPCNSELSYGLVGYLLKNTLSDKGYVNRGQCTLDQKKNITNITEITHIENSGGEIFRIDKGKKTILDGDTIVSTTFYGLTPEVFDYATELFNIFLEENSNNPESEFYVTSVITYVIKKYNAKMKMLKSNAQWMGVTYKEDKEKVTKTLERLVEQKVYPQSLWD